MDSNHQPFRYERSALTNCARGPCLFLSFWIELEDRTTYKLEMSEWRESNSRLKGGSLEH